MSHLMHVSEGSGTRGSWHYTVTTPRECGFCSIRPKFAQVIWKNSDTTLEATLKTARPQLHEDDDIVIVSLIRAPICKRPHVMNMKLSSANCRIHVTGSEQKLLQMHWSTA